MNVARLLTFAIALLASTTPAAAQSIQQLYAKRSTLEQRASEAERIAAASNTQNPTRELKRGEAFMIRYRLEHGDFRAGDRVVVTTVIDQARTDTLLVSDDRSVEIAGFPRVSLRGVLRSELEDRLRTHLAVYVREPRVTAKPLVRIAVTGRVARPGFYNVPADALLSDVIMTAGGPAAGADMAKTTVRRDTAELWTADAVRVAINDGFTVDSFNLQAGDELVIGAQRQTNWEALLRNTGVVVGLVSIFVSVR